MNSVNWLIRILLIFFLSRFSFSADTITLDHSIQDNNDQVIVSAGNIFALGFFSPATSTNRYVGIWYYQIPVKTAVWVANRDNPINDTSGILRIDGRGNLALFQGNQTLPLWSTNISIAGPVNSFTQILDSGNLVLLQNDTGKALLWQSFGHPTNTWLSHMKIGFNLRTGLNQSYTSRKSPDDPGVGNYSLRMKPGVSLYKGSVPVWRSGTWTGIMWSGIPAMAQTLVFIHSFVNTDDELSFSFHTNASLITRFIVTNETGVTKRISWNNASQSWTTSYLSPIEQCDFYGHCGPNGYCNPYVALALLFALEYIFGRQNAYLMLTHSLKNSPDTSQAQTPAVTTGTQPTVTPAAASQMSFQGRNQDETGLQMGYDGNQRQYGSNSNTGYSNSNVGYSQRIDTPIQAYSHVFTPMSQQVACYTPLMQQGLSCQFGYAAGLHPSVSQSSRHLGLALSPTSSGHFFGSSSQFYPSAPHSSVSGSGLPTALVSSSSAPHSLSPSVASSSVASGPAAFMARSSSLVASPSGGSSTAYVVSHMDNSSCLPLVSPSAVVVSGNRQGLISEGVTASVNEESVVPTDGCGNSSSHDFSIQPNVAVDVNITSGHAAKPHIGETHREAGTEVLAEFDTETHVARQDEVGVVCVGTSPAGQNDVNPDLCDRGLCSIEGCGHHAVSEEAATLVPSIPASTGGLCNTRCPDGVNVHPMVSFYVEDAVWNEMKLGEY
ncbi:hypothetical protein V6N11_034270 [Hibiscus sabdariffa]|uniref:Bulb-type lectin domain-containing protein n=1 Tax=Hibiscus sabdariffa TaxID=183260 RepID=A0ABR2N8F4_9ROSI